MTFTYMKALKFLAGAIVIMSITSQTNAQKAETDNRFINADPARLAHGVLVPEDSELLYLGGQVGLDSEGEMPAGYEEQLELIFENTKMVLDKADMGPEDIIFMTYYVVTGDGRMDQSYWNKIFEIRDRVLGDVPATGALIYVPALYRPDALVEISSVAARQR